MRRVREGETRARVATERRADVSADDIIALAHSLTTLALAVADLASHTHAAKASIAILAP
jgi:hypothetical protein